MGIDCDWSISIDFPNLTEIRCHATPGSDGPISSKNVQKGLDEPGG